MIKLLPIAAFIFIASAILLIRPHPEHTEAADVVPLTSATPVPMKTVLRVVEVDLGADSKEAAARIEIPEALYKAATAKKRRLLVVGTVSYTTQDGKSKTETVRRSIDLTNSNADGNKRILPMSIVLREAAKTGTIRFNDVTGEEYEEIAALLKRRVGNECFDEASGVPADADNDPTNGVQLECQLSDVHDMGSDREVSEVVPMCPTRSLTTFDLSSPPVPCWWYERNATRCPKTSTHILLHVERGGAEPPLGTTTVVRCRTSK